MIRKIIVSVVLFFFISLGLNAQRCGAVLSGTPFSTAQNEGLNYRGLIIIPIVIHVVYKNGNEAISPAQINSQIEVLNQDYSALNNLNIIPDEFMGAIADMEIQFCLAVRDPQGNPTTGITYTETTIDNIGIKSNVFYAQEEGVNAWSPAHYLNIWIADMGENQTGRSSFPGMGLAEEDGVVIDPRYFGTIEKAEFSQPYNLGRTATHEIGHYLNLMHVWGPDPVSCNADDEVADTPVSGQTFLFECPTDYLESCGSSDMYTNFMNYTNDACMGQFTPGQRARAKATILTLRPELLNSLACVPPEIEINTAQIDFLIFSNPNKGQFKIKLNQFPGNNIKLELFDFRGQFIWTGQYTFLDVIDIDLPGYINSGVYLLKVSSGELQQTQKLILIP